MNIPTDPHRRFSQEEPRWSELNFVLGQEAGALTALEHAKAVPHDMQPDRRTFEKLGFAFKDRIEVAGVLCMECTLPEGWKYARGDEPREIYIRDETDKKRAYIFFKISEHDPKGYMSEVPRDYKD